MTETLALNYGPFEPLAFDEMLGVDGGVNWDRVFTGVAIFGAAVIAIASLPVTLTVVATVAVCVGCVALGAASGYYIGSGIRNYK